MALFRSLKEFKRLFDSGQARCERPDDGRFDLVWITKRENAWRLAEADVVPFTRTIQKGKHNRASDDFVASLEPGTLPVKGKYEVPDAHFWLIRIKKAFEASVSRDQVNVLLELFLHSALSYAVPSRLALVRMAEFSTGKLVEIGAGRGYWAALLENLGVSCRAYDTAPDRVPSANAPRSVCPGEVALGRR